MAKKGSALPILLGAGALLLFATGGKKKSSGSTASPQPQPQPGNGGSSGGSAGGSGASGSPSGSGGSQTKRKDHTERYGEESNKAAMLEHLHRTNRI